MSRSALLLLLLSLVPVAAHAQDYWHRWTFGIGGWVPVAEQTRVIGGSTLLSADYGYHFSRYGQADIGGDFGFANNSVRIPRFGYRGILPLMRDKIEASLGGGAGYVFLKPTIGGYEQWLIYAQGGANYALDRDKRYRAGIMVRWYRDPVGRPVHQWVTVGAEFTLGQ